MNPNRVPVARLLASILAPASVSGPKADRLLSLVRLNGKLNRVVHRPSPDAFLPGFGFTKTGIQAKRHLTVRARADLSFGMSSMIQSVKECA